MAFVLVLKLVAAVLSLFRADVLIFLILTGDTAQERAGQVYAQQEGPRVRGDPAPEQNVLRPKGQPTATVNAALPSTDQQLGHR